MPALSRVSSGPSRFVYNVRIRSALVLQVGKSVSARSQSFLQRLVFRCVSSSRRSASLRWLRSLDMSVDSLSISASALASSI